MHVSLLSQFARRRNIATKKRADTNCNILRGTVTCSFICANSALLSLRLRFRAGDWPIVNSTTVDDVFHGASGEYSRHTFALRRGKRGLDISRNARNPLSLFLRAIFRVVTVSVERKIMSPMPCTVGASLARYDRLNNEIAPSIRGRLHFAVNDPSPRVKSRVAKRIRFWSRRIASLNRTKMRRTEGAFGKKERTCGERRDGGDEKRENMSDAAAWLHSARRSCARSGATERVRVGMKERVESPHVREPSCSSTCVTQFRNFSSLGNVGRKNRV